MVRKLKHRGPDNEGNYFNGPIGLGHARLSVIDLKTGQQPLSNEDGRYWISYNGEIFNYIELRKDLQAKGHLFYSESDTEVVVHGYEEYGTKFFRMMNGQWALAIWDNKKKELLLCRDRVGICPLYYTQASKKILFASEVKALLCDKDIPREIDLQGIAQTFTFWTTVAPQTVFRGIKELQPGHWIRFRPDNVTEKAYWHFTFPSYTIEDTGTIEEYAGKLRKEIIHATRLRFTRSDVPVAAYLSGGIDSSITAAIIKQFTKTDLKTFSLQFSDKEFDERGYQQQMISRLCTDHAAITVSHQDIGNIFPEVIKHTERPILRTAPAPMYLLSQFVRESGYKVVVTGEGSDEMLGGYDIFREAIVRNFIARNPHSEKRAEIIQQLYPWLQRNPAGMPAFARNFFSKSLNAEDPALSHRPRWQSAAGLTRLLHKDIRSDFAAYDVSDQFLNNIPSEFKTWHTLSKAQWIEVKTLLSGYLLASQGDRMLMANSVEGRFPFLDPLFIDQAAHIPPRYKIMGLNEKYLLKYAFRDLIPSEILKRPKQPYRAPDAASFFGSPLDWVEELTSPETVEKSDLFNPKAISHLVGKCRKRKGQGMSNFDNMAITAVLSTLLLQQQLIRFS